MKKQWVHRARKQDNYKSDTEQKNDLNWTLRRHFGFAGCFDRVAVGTPAHFKKPDLIVEHRDYVFELDGEYHGFGDAATTSDKDKERESWYAKRGYKLFVINKYVTEKYREDLVIARLEAQGLERI